MSLLVTVHAVVGIVAIAIAAAAGKEAAWLKHILLGSPVLCNKNGMISAVYVFPGCTPYSVTLVLLMTVIGDWSELTLCVIRYK